MRNASNQIITATIFRGIHDLVPTRVSTVVPRGPALTLVRAAWIAVAALGIGLFVTATSIAWREPSPECTSIECDPYELSVEDLSIAQERGLPARALKIFSSLWQTALSTAFIIMAIFIFLRRSNDSIALLLSIDLLMMGAVVNNSVLGVLVRFKPELAMFMELVGGATLLLFVLLLYLFPDGRFAPRWMRWGALILPLVLISALPGVPYVIGYALLTLLQISGVVSQIYRFVKVSGPVQRQQTKWVVLGLIGFVLGLWFWLFMTALFPADRP